MIIDIKVLSEVSATEGMQTVVDISKRASLKTNTAFVITTAVIGTFVFLIMVILLIQTVLLSRKNNNVISHNTALPNVNTGLPSSAEDSPYATFGADPMRFAPNIPIRPDNIAPLTVAFFGSNESDIRSVNHNKMTTGGDEYTNGSLEKEYTTLSREQTPAEEGDAGRNSLEAAAKVYTSLGKQEGSCNKQEVETRGQELFSEQNNLRDEQDPLDCNIDT